MGWSLPLASVARRTDKGLPQYRDDEESDVFILSGAEDLVPVLNDAGERVRDELSEPGYVIERYRPRVEGLFARIERWTRKADRSDVSWRSISRDNVTTWYGRTAESRIADPADAVRIFSWLICESYDDRGNAIVYRYKAENAEGVDTSQSHESSRNPNPLIRTANRYLKRIQYGNRVSRLVDEHLSRPQWMFEIVVDYGEHDAVDPRPRDDEALDANGEPVRPWLCRNDPRSNWKATFETRCYRLAQRLLQFHHFPGDVAVGADCLVRATELAYRSSRGVPEDTKRGHPAASVMASITQAGFRRAAGGGYVRAQLPPLELEYSEAKLDETVRRVDPASLENLPRGVDGATFQWLDLDGEGIPGILAEQDAAWFYKCNLSARTPEPGRKHEAAFGPREILPARPNAALAAGAQFMDLAGDGSLDVVVLQGGSQGFYERTKDAGWESFRDFMSRLNVAPRDPRMRLADLDNDGLADVLITEGEAYTWHASLGEGGFARGQRVPNPLEGEDGPALVFSDGAQAAYLVDMNGDGLPDLLTIRNDAISYHPSRGRGRFGPKVTMDGARPFDAPDQFDPSRLRLASIEGLGTDIIYLTRRHGADLYRNLAGNRWDAPRHLDNLPGISNAAAVALVDLFGNGTSCLVWSSPLKGDAGSPMRYVDLTGGGGAVKPNLLVKVVNHLGAETLIEYASSTRFYIDDKLAGRPWLTRLPFPVHVVERVHVYDRIGRSRFVTRYAYHHGYFDGSGEREFRGFGLVEEWSSEEFAALCGDALFPMAVNVERASHLPPMYTKTWFHTGAYFEDSVTRQFASEYYDEGDTSSGRAGLSRAQLAAMQLEDTVLPTGLTAAEEREACRALKGSILRQEVYALDGGDAEDRPYSVSERNYTVEVLQRRHDINRHAVFFTHPRETLEFHYERKLYKIDGGRLAEDQVNPPAGAFDACDPRVSHSMTLEVDRFGNVLKSAAVAYGRRFDDFSIAPDEREKQKKTWVTWTSNQYTDEVWEKDDYRAPLPWESRTYELLNVAPQSSRPRVTNLFRLGEISAGIDAAAARELEYEDVEANGMRSTLPYRRLLECQQTRYRSDGLDVLLPLRSLQSKALPGETYRLALTPGHVGKVYRRGGADLMADPSDVLRGHGGDRGGYVERPLGGAELYWWIPSGRVYYSPDEVDAGTELSFAQEHFFLPHRFQDPFLKKAIVTFDEHHLLLLQTEDAVGNKVTAGERGSRGGITNGNDYRVLKPALVCDPNGCLVAAAFDALGLVVATAVRDGGDEIEGLVEDLSPAQLDAFMRDPLGRAADLLGNATTRVVYDLLRYYREPVLDGKPPVYAATLSRGTHLRDLGAGRQSRIQVALAVSDGFGREIQKKMRAEPGRVPERDATSGEVITGRYGIPKMTDFDVPQRWVTSGWSVYSNRWNKPVRQYEPFFTHVFDFEFAVRIGMSPVLFYDAVGRVVGTLRPDHAWEKTVFDPWRTETWDVNDTLLEDPARDAELGAYFTRLPDREYLPTWYAERSASADAAERDAARNTRSHARTPTTAHLDSLGRTILTAAHNGWNADDVPVLHETRTEYDVEGNVLFIKDPRKHIAMDHRVKLSSGNFISGYDLAGNLLYQNSLDGGQRWILHDVLAKPVRRWDSREHEFILRYDALRRPLEAKVLGGEDGALDLVYDRIVYGEGIADAAARNLRGRPFEHYDTAGLMTYERYDRNGSPLRSSRQFAADYRNAPDWRAARLDPRGPFTTEVVYNALNKIVSKVTPDGSITRWAYNDAALLESVQIEQGGAATDVVTSIAYDASGRREEIVYGNGVTTTYAYDERTRRLETLASTTVNKTLQDLKYTYDPVGNVCRIVDGAQPTIFFGNLEIEAISDYTYDALYRLVLASGREHRGQIDFGDVDNWDDAAFCHRYSPTDAMAWRTYHERYEYDKAGNFDHITHDAGMGTWVRRYYYEEGNNRLAWTTVDGESYHYMHHRAHGFITSMPHMKSMEWNFKDELRQASKQVRRGRMPETTYFVYDAAGQRVRKVTDSAEAQDGSIALASERLYFGAAERHEEASGLVRWTLDVMDERQRVAMVETRVAGHDNAPARLLRYQHGDHLGSVSLETRDGDARVVGYEIFHPLGTTAYQAMDRDIMAAAKRYRHAAGKERDDETGLYYYGARYYAPWLGRWLSCDPKGVGEGLLPYEFCRNAPLNLVDPSGESAAPPALNTEDVLQAELREAAFELGKKREAKHGLEALLPTDQAAINNVSREQGQEVMGQLKKNLAESSTTNRYPGVSRRVVPEVHIVDKQIQSAGGNPAPGGRNPDIALTKSEMAGIDPAKEWEALKGEPTSVLEKQTYDVKMGGGYVKDKKGFTQKTDLTATELRPSGKKTLDLAGTPPSASALTKTGGSILETGAKESGKLKKLAKGIGEVLAEKGAKVVPFLGTAVGTGLAAKEAYEGNYAAALVEAAGASEIPIVAQVADIGSLAADIAWVVKDVLDPEQKVEQWWYETFLK